MRPGPADSVRVVRGGTETRAWESLPGVLDRAVAGAGDHSLPTLVGSWLGNLSSMFLAAVILVLLGLAIVALRHSDLLTSVGGDTSSTREPDREPMGDTGSVTPDSTLSDEPTADVEPPGDEEGQQTVESRKTDAEEIVDILEANDGRMRQAAIVESTDWSKSKVSMVLSEMEDDDEVSKLRVGRENIVSLRGNEPEAAGSPFDDE